MPIHVISFTPVSFSLFLTPVYNSFISDLHSLSIPSVPVPVPVPCFLWYLIHYIFYLNPIPILARPDFVYKLSMSIVVLQFVNYVILLSVPSPISSSSSTLLFFSKSNLWHSVQTPSHLRQILGPLSLTGKGTTHKLKPSPKPWWNVCSPTIPSSVLTRPH